MSPTLTDRLAAPAVRAILRPLAALLLCAGLAPAVLAQTSPAAAAFPSRPVRLLVTYPPGGAGDMLGRSLAAGLQNAWGKAVVVENQAGASGIIAVETVIRAAPDGHTLTLVGAGPFAVLPFMMDKLSYDPVNDMLPIAMIVSIPNVLVVNGASPIKTFKEFLAAAKSKPGGLDYASSGKGQSHHMMMEYMMRATGVRLNDIPYKGGAPALLAVSSGEVQAAWLAVSTAVPLIRNGQLRGLALSTAERFPQLAEVPTVAEQGFAGFDLSFWLGVMGSAKLPAALARKIESDTRAVVFTDSFKETLRKSGNVVRFETSEQFTRTIRDEYARNKAILAP